MPIFTEFSIVPIQILKQYPKNPRIHPKKNIDDIKKSLKEFSQYSPIIVEGESNSILAGNGTFQAMLELGYQEIKIIKIYGLSQEQKDTIVILDNKLNESSTWIVDSLQNDIKIKDCFYENLCEILNIKNNKETKSKSEKKDILCPVCQNKMKVVEIQVDKIKRK